MYREHDIESGVSGAIALSTIVRFVSLLTFLFYMVAWGHSFVLDVVKAIGTIIAGG